MIPSDEQLERAQDLLCGHRVVLTGQFVANCASDSGGHYTIISMPEGITCDCEARKAPCAHALAAAVLWHERDVRQRGDDALAREVFG